MDYTSTIRSLEKHKSNLLADLLVVDQALDALIKLNTSATVGDGIKSTSSIATPSNKNGAKISPYEDYEVVIPKEYDKELTMIEMLIFAIDQKNGATAQDAATYISLLDNEIDIELLKRRFTDIASGLGRAKKLNIKKIGKKFKYSLKPVERVAILDSTMLEDLDKEFELNK
jgi:hypothetical protein